eukprot:gnl/Trimastix_PCT/1672.p1 GENE.gnl/Trimastix_PCT/1672~~gnl/Trimastix_PCT/1672.p1  ORF type:complete len:684 (+),score=138.31 gnl/Trimastix_PCT/1672:99-2150(+)
MTKPKLSTAQLAYLIFTDICFFLLFAVVQFFSIRWCVKECKGLRGHRAVFHRTWKLSSFLLLTCFSLVQLIRHTLQTFQISIGLFSQVLFTIGQSLTCICYSLILFSWLEVTRLSSSRKTQVVLLGMNIVMVLLLIAFGALTVVCLRTPAKYVMYGLSNLSLAVFCLLIALVFLLFIRRAWVFGRRVAVNRQLRQGLLKFAALASVGVFCPFIRAIFHLVNGVWCLAYRSLPCGDDRFPNPVWSLFIYRLAEVVPSFVLLRVLSMQVAAPARGPMTSRAARANLEEPLLPEDDDAWVTVEPLAPSTNAAPGEARPSPPVVIQQPNYLIYPPPPSAYSASTGSGSTPGYRTTGSTPQMEQTVSPARYAGGNWKHRKSEASAQEPPPPPPSLSLGPADMSLAPIPAPQPFSLDPRAEPNMRAPSIDADLDLELARTIATEAREAHEAREAPDEQRPPSAGSSTSGRKSARRTSGGGSTSGGPGRKSGKFRPVRAPPRSLRHSSSSGESDRGGPPTLQEKMDAASRVAEQEEAEEISRQKHRPMHHRSLSSIQQSSKGGKRRTVGGKLHQSLTLIARPRHRRTNSAETRRRRNKDVVPAPAPHGAPLPPPMSNLTPIPSADVSGASEEEDEPPPYVPPPTTAELAEIPRMAVRKKPDGVPGGGGGKKKFPGMRIKLKRSASARLDR